jgi:hypothetical protein
MKGSTSCRRFCWLQVNFSYGHEGAASQVPTYDCSWPEAAIGPQPGDKLIAAASLLDALALRSHRDVPGNETLALMIAEPALYCGRYALRVSLQGGEAGHRRPWPLKHRHKFIAADALDFEASAFAL